MMGCDIHLYVEKRLEDGTWEAVKGRNPRIDANRKRAAYARERGDDDYAKRLEDEAAAIEAGGHKPWGDDKPHPYPEYHAPEIYKDWVWGDRNYDLFAILANVRNGYGFAGVPTSFGFLPISEPRGLPSDVSQYIQGQSNWWGCDGHSHSWLSVADLLSYNWDLTTTKVGVVTQEQYKHFKEHGSPNSWCGGVSGRDVRHVSNEVMDRLIAGEAEREEGAHYYTRVMWDDSYKSRVGDFYTTSIPLLKEMAGDDPASVRLVFWFDN